MHVDEQMLAPVRAAYGDPVVLEWCGEVSEPELALITHDPLRTHDVTLFVFNAERLALIRKPHFAPGLWRTPGGGVKPGEEFAEAIRREALEEIGVDIVVERYIARADATFLFGGGSFGWTTHVFTATTTAEELEPIDTEEIESARWGSSNELNGPIRERLLSTGHALWRYRVALHDASLEALER